VVEDESDELEESDFEDFDFFVLPPLEDEPEV
jgi:hypothetical protein